MRNQVKVGDMLQKLESGSWVDLRTIDDAAQIVRACNLVLDNPKLYRIVRIIMD